MNEFIKKLMEEKRIKLERVYKCLDEILNVTTIFFENYSPCFDPSIDAFSMSNVVEGYDLKINSLVDSGMVGVYVVNNKGSVVALFTYNVITNKIDKQYSKIDKLEDELEFVKYFANLSNVCDHMYDSVDDSSSQEKDTSDEDSEDALKEKIIEEE